METAILRNLLRQRNLAVSNNKDVESVGQELSTKIRYAISDSVSISRFAGFKQANSELKLTGTEVSGPIVLLDYFLQDYVNARRYAANFSDLWLKHAKQSINNGNSFRESVRNANQGTLYRLQLIAGTESNKAYTEGRNAAAKSARAPGLNLVKVWDSTMDRNSCHTCYSNNGKICGLAEKFSFGEPGFIHPLCRCTYTIVSEEEASLFLQ